jgi:hypothetical protein
MSEARPGARTEAPALHVELAAEDRKPLYDYALACKACHTELAAAQGEL